MRRGNRVVTACGFSTVMLIAVLAVDFFSRFTPPSFLNDLYPRPDVAAYVGAAHFLVLHGQFAMSINGHILPSRYSIGFPLLIVPVYWIAGVQHSNAIFSVIALDMVSVTLIYWMGKRLFGWWAGFLAASIVVLSPLDRLVSMLIMSDAPSTTSVLLALGSAILATEPASTDAAKSRRLLLFAAASGVLLGYACWIRQIDAIYLPALALFLFLAVSKRRAGWSRRVAAGWPAIGALIAGWLALQLPTFLFNWYTFGSITRTGYNLWVPFWYDHFWLTFSLEHAFGPQHQAATYLAVLLGLPRYERLHSLIDTGLAMRAYPVPVAALALLGIVSALFGLFEWEPTVASTTWSERGDDDAIMGQAARFAVVSVVMIALTYVVYALYFEVDLRFLDLCVPLVAIQAAGGAMAIRRAVAERLGGSAAARHAHAPLGHPSPLRANPTSRLVEKRLEDRSLLLVSGARASWVVGLMGILVVVGLFANEVTTGVWWRGQVHGEILPGTVSVGYESMRLVDRYTEPNAVIISDIEPEFFGAYQDESQRQLLPLTVSHLVPTTLPLPPFKDRPELVVEAIQRGRGVYYVGLGSEFLKVSASKGFALQPVAAEQVGSGGFILTLYRVLHLDDLP